MLHLHGFKPGANITILNTMKNTIQDSNHYHELLTLVFKDVDSGIKYKEEIIDPEMTYYVVKPEKQVPYNRLFVNKDDVIEKTTTTAKLNVSAAEAVGLKNWYYDCIKSGDRSQARMIHMHPNLFGTDTNIEDYYRFQFDQTYVNNPYPISKAYFDIEVDSINMAGDFPEPGECPVNAITVVFEEQKQVFSLLLRTANNPQIPEFEEFIGKDHCNDLKEFIKNHVNQDGVDLYDKYKLNQFQFNIAFFNEDEELELIKTLFNLINTYKPDFALAWNMAFDIPYLIARIEALNANPAEIICHPHFQYKIASYYIDERNKNEFAERGDSAYISSYTVYMDQMIQYASRRKGQTRPISFGLDYIGYLTAKVHKLDYKQITTNIAELPYKDFKTFVYYNIMDTICQYCIEFICDDISYTFGKALMNNTRYPKVHRQTTYLANRGRKEFYADGFIIGNNFNRMNDPPTEKFPGAFVADPLLVSNYSRLRINNRPVNIFNYLDDFD